MGGSAFLTSNPKEINYQIIEYENNAFKYRYDEIKNRLCLCTNDQNFNCTAEELSPVYPGQKYSLKLTACDTAKTVAVYTNEVPVTACRSKTSVIPINVFSGNCTAIDFTFVFQSRNSCDLFLQGIAEDVSSFTNECAYMSVDLHYIEYVSCGSQSMSIWLYIVHYGGSLPV